MAESVVSSVGQTIGKLLIDEAKFLWGVEGNVEDLQRELKLIQCFLRDADARSRHDRLVGEWVAQLRDIAYDAEDVIERYTLRVALKEGRNIIKAYACFMAKCKCVPAYVVGTEIEGLKSRISDIGRRMQNYGIQSLTEGECERAGASTPKRTYAHFEEDIVGREDSIKVLVKELKDEKQHRVVSIWGMGGLGKTALAKKVFAHDEVKNHFNGFAWVCVSQECRARDILEGILVKLIPNRREGVTKMRNDEMFETLYTTQKEKTCIVVLDDIWTKEAWDSLRSAFPVENTRSKLLITTRNRDVAEYINPQGFFHELRCLSDLESWDLLKKRAFPDTKVGQGIDVGEAVEGIERQSETVGHIPVITQDMKRLGDELLKKCGGLPLAIIVLGGLLAINEWKMIHEKINLHFGDESDISKVLALSYDDLPWHLKPCFLYLGSFPEDAKIPAMNVLHMWIAEGFVSLNAYDKERQISMENIAEQYLMELVKRGMVQVRVNLSGKIKTCHLHDLMRDLCVSKALQESFLSFLNIHQDNEMEDCSSSMAMNVNSTCKIRRLSLNLHDSGNGKMIWSIKIIRKNMLKLRTLMFFESGEGNPKKLQPIFINCKFLKVLKLEALHDIEGNFLPESVGDVVHLKFLSLAGSFFEGLPQSLGNLVYMEFLDIRSSSLRGVTVPNVLWKMRRLRYLWLPVNFSVENRFRGDRKKLQLDTLHSLRILKNFSLYTCDVNDLGKLTNLRKLTITGKRNSNDLKTIPQLAKCNLKHLQSSSFMFKSISFTESELGMTSSCRHSCKLFLVGKLEKFPEHGHLPRQLRKLFLGASKLKEDLMPILEKLDHLVVLLLSNAFEGKKMVCSAGGFPQLKHLLLCSLLNLEEWSIDEGAMPHLSRLGIWYCPKLKAVPQGVPPYEDDFDLYHEHFTNWT
ncbi:hypothetical protein BT93_L2979 [Corymbia citriodora subsp. variegata]|uniref:Disease resistance protein n=1 Tax=Corymbia citriodora subsp. variegata TaxID=360336 RepID=A0A8T0CMP1_CORYI|nr:hypothetical protein BT93_L2979 [Corymbia citriodora subsp. variegata]